jgi:hypothetical protein
VLGLDGKAILKDVYGWSTAHWNPSLGSGLDWPAG